LTGFVSATRLCLPGRLAETDLALDAGQLVCLVGPNGSGKTSLLHALAGIGRPAGTVAIDGLDRDSVGPGGRSRLVSYLPATRDINWPLSVRDLVALGSPQDDAEAVARILADLGLAALAERRVDRLSTGERSRALIARALAAGPKLLLLDEPVANLDPLWQLRLIAHLRGLAPGKALLVAMHDLDMAGRCADRLIVMDRGTIVADGDPTALLAGPVIPSVFGIERIEGLWRAIA